MQRPGSREKGLAGPAGPPPVPKRPRDRWIRAAALALSSMIHALILFMPIDVRIRAPAGGTAAGPSGVEQALVMHVHDIVATSSELETPRIRLGPERSPDEPGPVASDENAGQLETGSPERVPGVRDGSPSLRERVVPRATDPRLWRGGEAPPEPVSDLERAREPVRELVEALNDSIAVVKEAERRASDWTRRDESGGRWGISPDRIHLGGLTLTLRYCTVEPCEGWLLPTPTDRLEEYTNRLRGFEEIRRQAGRAEVESALRGRAKAIRARMGTRQDTTGGE